MIVGTYLELSGADDELDAETLTSSQVKATRLDFQNQFLTRACAFGLVMTLSPGLHWPTAAVAVF